ncbi:MAG: exosortase A [Proteobacteria bacterium]|nr:exosortase A [Pseudomonadota bacterium]
MSMHFNSFNKWLFVNTSHPWRVAITVLLVALSILIAAYHNTLCIMLDVWNTHTYAHCYLIVPISAYLIWDKRSSLVGITPVSEKLPIIFIALFGMVWLVGYNTDVNALQEYAMVTMIPVLVWVILGRKLVLEIIFPLCFLLFCVPFGDFMLPSMIEFTADFTVGMIRLSGMPVYREGNYFSIPSGDWSVVEACAGLRYLIASITLGTLYAYINYRSAKLRILFVILSGIVPIFLNGIRAYLIVMIAHFSGMKLGVGEDHFIYGWLFFGLGMALLFWFGSTWRENTETDIRPVGNKFNFVKWNHHRMVLYSIYALIVSGIWPLKAAYIESYPKTNLTELFVLLPEPKPPWRYTESITKWKPMYYGSDVEKQVYFTDGSNTVGVFFEYYNSEVHGRELISSSNKLITEKHPIWKLLEEVPTIINIDGYSMNILQGILKSKDQTIVVWRFNWVSGIFTSSNIQAKLLKARDLLFGKPNYPQAAIIIVIDPKDDVAKSKETLQNFVNVMMPSIHKSLQLSSANRNQ